jgi:hypothetical protein
LGLSRPAMVMCDVFYTQVGKEKSVKVNVVVLRAAFFF